MKKISSSLFSLFFISFLVFQLAACGGGLDGDDDDTSPDEFSFEDEDDVGLAEYVISEEVEIEGINAATEISIEGGEYSINGGEFTDEEGEIYDGQTVRIRLLSSDDLSTETEATLYVGDEEDTFTVETVDIALTARDGFKNIIFSWPTVSGATSYRILEKADENADFIQKGREMSSAAVGYTMDLAIHMHDWLGAEYKLEACTNASCSTTDEISLYNYMRRSIGYIKASNAEENDQFGIVAMSADGKTIAVGAPAEDSGSLGVNRDDGDNSMSGSGAVYVYIEDGEAWRLQAYIKASIPDEGDGFGSSVSLSSDGNTLIVGAPYEDGGDFSVNGNALDNSAQDAGAVYVFERFGDTWFEHNYLKPAVGSVGELFGSKVEISDFGATLAVSAIGNDDPADSEGTGGVENAGAVYLFKRDGDNWVQIDRAKAEDVQAGANFGSDISLSANGSRLLVGAQYFVNAADPAEMSGTVYVFDRSGDDWTQTQAVMASNAREGMQFGASVALAANGQTFVVGAPGEQSSGFGVNGEQQDSLADESGAAYVFALNAGSWQQTTYIKAVNSDIGDRFATDVDINSSGDLIAVGAIGESSAAEALHGNYYDNSVTEAGAVYIFKNNDGWQHVSYVKAPNTDAGDRFGRHIGLDASGDALVVGAPNEQSDATGLSGSQPNNTANKSGAAYLY